MVNNIIYGFGRSLKPPNVPVTLDPSLFHTLTSYHSLRNSDSCLECIPNYPFWSEEEGLG